MSVHDFPSDVPRFTCRRRRPNSFFEPGKTKMTLNVVSLSSASAKCVALGSAYMLYMDQNVVGSSVPDDVSRRTAYGESVCWLTAFDNRTVVEQWLALGHGDPEWLWRHEALVFGARYLAEHLPAKVQAIDGLAARRFRA